MQISEYGVRFIKAFEKFSAKPYPDPGTGAEPYTIGYGTTIYPNGKKVTMKDADITEDQATGYLKYEVENKCIPAIEKNVTVQLTQDQVDSLCSFIYNVGAGKNGFAGSTLLEKINAKASCADIQLQFMRWVRAGGKILKGLVVRRDKESKLYCK